MERILAFHLLLILETRSNLHWAQQHGRSPYIHDSLKFYLSWSCCIARGPVVTDSPANHSRICGVPHDLAQGMHGLSSKEARSLVAVLALLKTFPLGKWHPLSP